MELVDDNKQGRQSKGFRRGNSLINEVLITGDLFRMAPSTANGWVWQQEDNIHWLYSIISGALASCPSISVSKLDHAKIGVDACGCYPEPGHSAETWWLKQIEKPVDPDFAAALRKAVSGRVVIAFEIPENIEMVIADTAIAVLQIAISPVRFANDLLLSVRTGNTLLANAIANTEICDRELFWQLGILRAQIGNTIKEKSVGLGNVALMVLQTPFDRSLVRDGKISRLTDFTEEIVEVSEKYDTVLVSPHPYSNGVISGIGELVKISNLIITQANCYRMLAAGIIKQVVSISSSVLSESYYFGVESHALQKYTLPKSPMITVGALGEDVAEAIAEIFGKTLPPLVGRRIENGPIMTKVLGYGWGKDKAKEEKFIIPALDIRSVPRLLTASEPEFGDALGYGWYPIEEWGVWCGPVGIMNINISCGQDLPIMCSLNLRSVKAIPEAQPCEIWSNGINVARFCLLDNEPVKVTFKIEKGIFDRPIQLCILCGNPSRPSELQYGNQDTRLLGIAMTSYELFYSQR